MKNNNTAPSIVIDLPQQPLHTTNDNQKQSQALALDIAVDSNYWPFPKVSSKGEIVGGLCHVENLEWLLCEYGITARYNVITKEQELNIPGMTSHLSDNSEGHKLEIVRSLCDVNGLPSQRVQEQLTAIANSKPWNPVVDYALSQPWDGNNRIGAVCDTVIVDDKIAMWRDAAVSKFLIAAICLAMNDGVNKFSVKAILVFQGRQGMGKTPWARILTGELSGLLEEGHLLNPESKDSVTVALKSWIVELGELDATTKKADVAALKAFITKHTDTIRLPYAAKISTWPRRTAFFGTVNPSSFLVDNTGNDRYWSLPVLDLKLGDLDKVDKQQLWAQVLHLVQTDLKNGVREPWALTADERVSQTSVNEAFRMLTPIEESITDMFRQKIEDSEPRYWKASLLNICDLAGFPKNSLSAKDKAAAETIITSLLGEQGSPYCGKRGWDIPLPDLFGDADMITRGIKQRKVAV